MNLHMATTTFSFQLLLVAFLVLALSRQHVHGAHSRKHHAKIVTGAKKDKIGRESMQVHGQTGNLHVHAQKDAVELKSESGNLEITMMRAKQAKVEKKGLIDGSTGHQTVTTTGHLPETAGHFKALHVAEHHHTHNSHDSSFSESSHSSEVHIAEDVTGLKKSSISSVNSGKLGLKSQQKAPVEVVVDEPVTGLMYPKPKFVFMPSKKRLGLQKRKSAPDGVAQLKHNEPVSNKKFQVAAAKEVVVDSESESEAKAKSEDEAIEEAKKFAKQVASAAQGNEEDGDSEAKSAVRSNAKKVRVKEESKEEEGAKEAKSDEKSAAKSDSDSGDSSDVKSSGIVHKSEASLESTSRDTKSGILAQKLSTHSSSKHTASSAPISPLSLPPSALLESTSNSASHGTVHGKSDILNKLNEEFVKHFPVVKTLYGPVNEEAKVKNTHQHKGGLKKSNVRLFQKGELKNVDKRKNVKIFVANNKKTQSGWD